jgi:hypothetical protein
MISINACHAKPSSVERVKDWFWVAEIYGAQFIKELTNETKYKLCRFVIYNIFENGVAGICHLIPYMGYTHFYAF